MSGASTILYEIYVKKSAEWALHANYAAHDSKNCLADAKELFDSGQCEAVRVVKEIFNTANNTAREEVIYRSPTRSRPNGPNAAMERPNGARPRNAAANGKAGAARPRARPRPKPKSEVASAGPAIVMAGLVGLGGAAFVTYLVVTAAQHLQGVEIALDDAESRNMIMSVFGISFILFFIPMMRSFGPSLREARSNQAGATAPAESAAADLAGRVAKSPAGGEAQFEVRTEESHEEQAQAQADFSEAAPEDAPSKEEAEAGPEAEPATPLRAAAASVSADLLKFIGESLERLVAAKRQLDAFNRFGLTLYFAGAGEYLASRQRLAADEMQDILCTHIQKLGHTLEMARRFCGNIDEYLVSPKYFRMYEAGREAVARRQQKPDGGLGIVEAMDFWNEPATPAAKQDNEFVAVVLTDIGVSPAMTQERGDEAARRAADKHDAIVRAVLAQHGGRKIKSVGDGVMATFPRLVGALEGAIAMQLACARANTADPELGLGLRIGVDAGEPIDQRGDNIGTPARMAARVLTEAQENEIAVSNIVRELCADKRYAFTKKGDYELAGATEPSPIHLLDWRADTDSDTGATAMADA